MPTVTKSDTRSDVVTSPWKRIVERRTRPTISGAFGPWVLYQNVSNGVYSIKNTSRSRSWQNETEFRQFRLAGAVLPDHSYSALITKSGGSGARLIGPYAVVNVQDQRRNVFEFDRVPPQYLPLPNTTLSISDIAAKLHERAKGSQFNTPVFLVEGRKTTSMVYDRAVKLVMLVRAAKKGDFRYFFNNLHISYENKPGKRAFRRWNKRFAADSSKAASDVWLEHRYGWLPFMSEVKSAVETTMDSIDRPENSVMRVSASKALKYTGNGVNHTLFNGGADGSILADSYNSYYESIRAIWKFTPTQGSLPGRFGLLNPLEVAWELVPFSFVADWFLPIGDYLAQFDVPFRFSHRGGTIGYVRSVSTTFTNVRCSTTDRGAVVIGGKGISSESIEVSRSRMVNIPAISLSSLSYSPSIGATRAITSIALLRQQLSRFPKR